MSNLPKITEIVNDLATYEKNDELNYLLNQEPPKKWVKEHPYIRGHKYLPIDKVEYLLRKIFKEYRIEVLREGTAFNGVFVVTRVHYKDLISGQWAYHDGIGSIELQTKKGTTPTDMANINKGAISMAFPLAKTLAIKDACDMFGKLFGADLNRRDTLPATLDSKKDENRAEIERLLNLKDIPEDNFKHIRDTLNKNRVNEYPKILNYLKTF